MDTIATVVAQSAEEARLHLRAALSGAVKARSIGHENDGLSEDDLATLDPWLYGARSVVPALQRRLDDPAPITPLEYRNFMHIVSRSPAIGICAAAQRCVLPTLEDLEDAPLAVEWPRID